SAPVEPASGGDVGAFGSRDRDDLGGVDDRLLRKRIEVAGHSDPVVLRELPRWRAGDAHLDAQRVGDATRHDEARERELVGRGALVARYEPDEADLVSGSLGQGSL